MRQLPADCSIGNRIDKLTGNTKDCKLVGCGDFALMTQDTEFTEFENLRIKRTARTPHTRLIFRPHYNWVDSALSSSVGLLGRGGREKLGVLKTRITNSE